MFFVGCEQGIVCISELESTAGGRLAAGRATRAIVLEESCQRKRNSHLYPLPLSWGL